MAQASRRHGLVDGTNELGERPVHPDAEELWERVTRGSNTRARKSQGPGRVKAWELLRQYPDSPKGAEALREEFDAAT